MRKSAQNTRGYDLVRVGRAILVPIAFYSKRYKSVNDIPAGATIAIPNDPGNGTRTLLLLETTGLIKLRPDAGFKATRVNIVENPKNIKFIELEAAQLARSLDDVHAAAVNTNYALQAGDLIGRTARCAYANQQSVILEVCHNQILEGWWLHPGHYGSGSCDRPDCRSRPNTDIQARPDCA